MRALWVVLVLAGCLLPAAAPSDAPAAASPVTLPWGLSDCVYVIASVSVDEAALRSVLPQGFAPSATSLAGIPGAGRGELHVDAYRCAGGVAADASRSTDVAYGSYYVPVAPPAELAEAGVEAYFVKFDFLAPDPAHLAHLAGAGLPAHAGDAEVTRSGARVEARLAFEDGTGFAFEGLTREPTPVTGPLPFVEYTPLAPREGAPSALARWHARLHDASASVGAGVVTFAPGSWPAEVVGAERAPATFITGTWNLDEADVTFPIPWP